MSKDKLATPLLDGMEKQNKLKDFEQNELLKKAYLSYHDDVLDDSLPHINLTPECEKIYITAFLAGTGTGMDMAANLHDKVFNAESPTLNRYSGTIMDEDSKELIN